MQPENPSSQFTLNNQETKAQLNHGNKSQTKNKNNTFLHALLQRYSCLPKLKVMAMKSFCYQK